MATPPRGANIVSQSLDAAGVKTVFSLSGNHIRSINAATIEANPEVIHIRHEAAALHMAVPFARLTGKVAEALGGLGQHVEQPEALQSAREEALASGRPACINASMDNIAAPVIRRC